MRKGWFQSLNALGIPVILFGTVRGSIHETTDFHNARNAGANGICSDRPTFLKSFLSEYPLSVLHEMKKKTN